MKKITYELARSLKDAGFPQMYGTGKSYYSFPDFEGKPALCATAQSVGDWGDFHEDEGDVYVPTLEELIEACGDELSWIHQIVHKNAEYPWSAQAHIREGDIENIRAEGVTPIEAIANLYMALNPKQ